MPEIQIELYLVCEDSPPRSIYFERMVVDRGLRTGYTEHKQRLQHYIRFVSGANFYRINSQAATFAFAL
jgi:hypothetical protein